MLFRLAMRQVTLKVDEGSTLSDVLEEDFRVIIASSQGILDPQHTATESPLPRHVSRHSKLGQEQKDLDGEILTD